MNTHPSPLHRFRRSIASAFLACTCIGVAADALAGPASRSSTLEGTVVHVEDGDTVILLDAARTQHTIRLADIDAPETCHERHDPTCRRRPGQPFGDKARLALAGIAKGHRATAVCRGAVNPGRDDRQVCVLNVDRAGQAVHSVNYELVRLGLAWVEPRFARDPQLFALGDDARRRRVGLWSMPNPIEPRQWRSQCWTEGRCPQ